MKDISSAAKIAKKARQIQRKEFHAEMQKHAEYYSRIIKPRPKWIPQGIYVWMLSLFLHVKK